MIGNGNKKAKIILNTPRLSEMCATADSGCLDKWSLVGHVVVSIAELVRVCSCDGGVLGGQLVANQIAHLKSQ